MTIKELKPGYLVQLKNGDISMVVMTVNGLVLADEPQGSLNSYMTLDNYKPDMTHEQDKLTIVKVYGYSKFACRSFVFDFMYRDLLWERKPEKKQYTYAQLREILGEEFEVIG